MSLRHYIKADSGNFRVLEFGLGIQVRYACLYLERTCINLSAFKIRNDCGDPHFWTRNEII